MPFLRLSLSAPSSPALTRQVAALLADLTVQLLHKDARLVAVVVDYIDPGNWLVGGQTLTEQCLASFFLDIRITEGTNTKEEKAAYQQQVFLQLGALLGPLHPVSYVCLHEVRAEAYGYGGLSQELRYGQRNHLPGALPVPPSRSNQGLHVPVE